MVVGEVEGSLTVTIEGDSNSAPNGTPVMTSTVPALAVTSKTGAYYAFYAQSKFDLTGKKTYWLRLKSPTISTYANHLVWLANGADAVTDGKAVYETAVGGVFADWTGGSSDRTNKTDLLFKLGCD